jgi:anaerobic selenocysteine-containing dehydrogenase
MMRAFESVDFKVTIDHFMTDTALASDVVLPCAYFLETTDVILPPAVHSYLTYCSPVVESDPWIPSEHWIFTALAKRLGLTAFPSRTEEEWLGLALRPFLEASKLTLEDLKAGPVAVTKEGLTAWPDLKFGTPSGRVELWSNRAGMDGFEPTAAYRRVVVGPSAERPFYLLTPHLQGSLHSQHFLDLQVEGERPVVYLGLGAAEGLGIVGGDLVEVSTETGHLVCTAEVDQAQRDDLVVIHEGWWLKKGGGVNQLIGERAAGMGLLAAYYEMVCSVEKFQG